MVQHLVFRVALHALVRILDVHLDKIAHLILVVLAGATHRIADHDVTRDLVDLNVFKVDAVTAIILRLVIAQQHGTVLVIAIRLTPSALLCLGMTHLTEAALSSRLTTAGSERIIILADTITHLLRLLLRNELFAISPLSSRLIAHMVRISRVDVADVQVTIIHAGCCAVSFELSLLIRHLVH